MNICVGVFCFSRNFSDDCMLLLKAFTRLSTVESAFESYGEFIQNVKIMSHHDIFIDGKLSDTLFIVVDGVEKTCQLDQLPDCTTLKGSSFDVHSREIKYSFEDVDGTLNKYHTYITFNAGDDYTSMFLKQLPVWGFKSRAVLSDHWINTLQERNVNASMDNYIINAFVFASISTILVMLIFCLACIIPYALGKNCNKRTSKRVYAII
eukprot:GHVH01001481.1.p1 GENE.GHVH01001481.1~~GHVH01001481.1.p1  ORF type:complete len:208 (+),score=23.02 GHVH01001481.1:283-906(+)